ncbi:serine/threonine-protein kinase tefu isoform X1 [Rhynchophorus ferrugineus]|uniref:serine/threonine-protein kinase tefu isoform X1 n=1 Tax=Rhynchophorus ferrugineus TaxID=354439 RepID=UPI003FCE0559
MNLQQALNQQFSQLNSNRITERKKCLERISDLLSKKDELENIRQSITWQAFLDAIKNSLKQECERIANRNGTAARNTGEQVFTSLCDIFGVIIKNALETGYNTIKISELIRYMDGCLRERNMRICRNTFLLTLKDYILPNYMCLGYVSSSDFTLIFELLKSEFNNHNNDVIFYNCLMLLLKHGPNCGLPAYYLREQFGFISKICQSIINTNNSKLINSSVMECVVCFCKHTVDDNRRGCIKLGEEIFMSLLALYKANDHELSLKENFLEFCLLQINIHNPNGVTAEDEDALAHDWNNWNKYIKLMHDVLTSEITAYFKNSVKNTLFFRREGTTIVILDTFVSLFVEVVNQFFRCKLSLDITSSNSWEQPQSKRRRLHLTDITSYIDIDESNNWIWIKLVGATLVKYPQLINGQSFMQLLRNVQSLQSKSKDNNTTRYIYELQGILIDVQKYLNLPHNEELSNLWKVIGKSAISAIELNQNIEATQRLLQKLIQNELVELEPTIEIYKRGVLAVTEHHVKTVDVLFRQIQFSDLPRPARMDILRWLLNFENVKDLTYLLEPDFAPVVVSLALKQYPRRASLIGQEQDRYWYLRSLYSRRNFDLKDLVVEEETRSDSEDVITFNYDSKMLEFFYQHIRCMPEYVRKESIKNQLCVFGMLCNVLNNFVEYKIIAMNDIEECCLFSIMRDIINDKSLVTSFEKYMTDDVRLLRELLETVLLLDNVWRQRHAITDYIRNITPLDFLRKLVQIMNHLHTVHKSEQELDAKLVLLGALSKYCLMSNSGDFNDIQKNLMQALSQPDYDVTSEVDYRMSICFLETIRYIKPGSFPVEIVDNILTCLSEICSERFRSFENAKEILGILKCIYTHLELFDTRHKTEAIKYLRDYYDHKTSNSPDIAIAILECVEVLGGIPGDDNCSGYTGINIITLIPTSFLSSEYQKVRYKAIEVLVKFVKRSSGTNNLEQIHRLEELFCKIYDNNLAVFAVEGNLTDERKNDETEFRTITALYMFVSLMINCHDWIEENLFSLIKLEHEKKLIQVFSNKNKLDILKKITSALETHFDCPRFLGKHLDYLLTKWLDSRQGLNDFPFILLNHADKFDFYKNHLDVCVPLLIRRDSQDLIIAARERGITEDEMLERSCTKIFAKALIENITKIGIDFVQKIPMLLDISRKLGDKMTDILVDHIDDVLLRLLTSISDSDLFHKTFREPVIFIQNGITYPEFERCLNYIEKELFESNNIIESLMGDKSSIVQRILLELQCNVHTAIAQRKFRRFHQYSVFVDIVVKSIKPSHQFTTYFVRDTVYFLINLVKKETDNLKLCQVVMIYIRVFLEHILPDNVKVFQDFAIYTINSIKNIALLKTEVANTAVEILEYLIVDNDCLLDIVKKLDIFPSKPEFSRLNHRHARVKYSGGEIRLTDEIESFVDYDRDTLSREDSLRHLKTLLATKKDQLIVMYNDLDSTGRLDNPANSLLHRLTCMLVKMSCHSNKNISFEAIKCLGELGPANLNSLVLQPKEVVFSINEPSKILTGYILSLLLQYLVNEDITLKKIASDTLYEMLKYKDIQKITEPPQKAFLTPFLTLNTITSHVHLGSDANWTHDSNIWCPSADTDSSHWIVTLVLELLKTFEPGSYLNDLSSLCEYKAKFCESILPPLINLLLQSKNQRIVRALSQKLNEFFAKHWALTVPECKDETSIVLNKKAVKSMLNVINFTRQQFISFEQLDLNYLFIARAAAFCSAHFTALLYGELWCRKEAELISHESRCSILDDIYEQHDNINGISLQNILQNAYKAIGDLDSLSGCGFAFLSNPDYRVEHYKKLGQWDKVMNYYSSRSLNSSDNNCSNLIESFKMNGYYQLPVLCPQLSSEPQYECLWRLGQWNVSGNEIFRSDKNNLKNYEKYHFNSLKALVDGDKYTFLKSKEECGMCIIENLKHTSLESSKNLYPILMQLQCLVEMDDIAELMEKQDIDAMFRKWDQQDQIVSKNDFEFMEPIMAQRMTLLDECIKKHPQLKDRYFKMILDFSDYAKNERRIKVAEKVIALIQKHTDLPETIKNEILYRDSQIAWLSDDKMMAQQLIRRLSNNNMSQRLKASVLKMQAEHMTEIYSDRSTIVQKFNESINLLETINDDLSEMNTEDRRNMEDTFDKIASFSDKQYQQIVNHMKSDLFQKKLKNMKLSKRRCPSMQSNMSMDAKRAAAIQSKQAQIEENEIEHTKAEEVAVLCLAVKYYLKNLLSCDTNNIKIFRVMSLLLANRDNKVLASEVKDYLSKLPSYKYITMLPQLVPHVSQNSDFFSEEIRRIVEDCAKDHPHHTLPLLLALVNSNKDKEYTKSTIKYSSSDRTETACYILNQLAKNKELRVLIKNMKELSDALIELAYSNKKNHTGSGSTCTIPSNLKIRKIKDFNEVLVPTCSLSVKKNNRYENIQGIVKFSTTYDNVGGINSPKKIQCLCTTGQYHLQLLKGEDDLRQDAVMQQVFGIITDLLSGSKQTKNMLIRTYKIVPLSKRSGILEWVANSLPIGSYLIKAHHKFRPNDCRVEKCKKALENCAKEQFTNKLKVYNKICRELKPVFHKFFETTFPQPSVWYEKRKSYTNSVATTSMCGYILGIGDRHVSNILIDEHSAELIHIDFGIAFEQGKCLPTPETVPFRLTRDIVDGMGVSGVEGLFRKSCEKTMEVLRTNCQTILAILEVLLYDPLYFWAVTSSEATRRQTEEDLDSTNSEEQEEDKNISAERALLRSKCKLQGTEEGKLTSVQQQVETLIRQAMDPANLCRLYHGWQAYL